MSEMNIGSEGSSEEDSSEESEKDEEWLPKEKTDRSRYLFGEMLVSHDRAI